MHNFRIKTFAKFALLHVYVFCSVATATAATLTGRVIHVVDGDGLIVRVGERRLTIRLADIDAPEHASRTASPHGNLSARSVVASSPNCD